MKSTIGTESLSAEVSDWKEYNKKCAKNEMYCVDATGDCCVGDAVRFYRSCFTGSFRNAKFSHYELFEGVIVKDSYGREKQQHTFTIRKSDGEQILIKGRNLYRNSVYRKMWTDESERIKVIDEKHSRGDVARADRRNRKNFEGLK